MYLLFFFFSSRRRHTRFDCDWSSDVCSSDLLESESKSAISLVTADFDSDSRPDIAGMTATGAFLMRNDGTGKFKSAADRSEERRVGKECRSRGSRDH